MFREAVWARPVRLRRSGSEYLVVVAGYSHRAHSERKKDKQKTKILLSSVWSSLKLSHIENIIVILALSDLEAHQAISACHCVYFFILGNREFKMADTGEPLWIEHRLHYFPSYIYLSYHFLLSVFSIHSPCLSIHIIRQFSS